MTFLDHPFGRVHPDRAEPVILSQLDCGVEPELCFPAGMVHVNVRPLLLAREEVEPIPSRPEDGRTHDSREASPRSTQGQGNANTNRLFPALGRSSGVNPVKCDEVPPEPVLTATNCCPSTA